MSYMEVKSVLDDLYKILDDVFKQGDQKASWNALVRHMAPNTDVQETEALVEFAEDSAMMMKFIERGYLKRKIVEENGKKIEKYEGTEKFLKFRAFLEAASKFIPYADGIGGNIDQVEALLIIREAYQTTGELGDKFLRDSTFLRLYSEEKKKQY